jgi:hypothetical protein
MKTITSAILGLALTFAIAGLSTAAQTTPQTPARDNGAPMAKKHVKKVTNASKTPAGAMPAAATKSK